MRGLTSGLREAAGPAFVRAGGGCADWARRQSRIPSDR